MSSAKEPWFVIERSEALAGLLLTSRADVSVQKEYPQDDGVDLLVAINTGEPLATRLFVAQVKGTTSADPNDWMRTVSHLFRGSGKLAYIPACVFVVNVRDNNAWYAWLAEPTVEPNGATLVFRQDGDFHSLDTSAVTEVVDRVKAWYDALPKQFLPA
jgi:hypothetical protein